VEKTVFKNNTYNKHGLKEKGKITKRKPPPPQKKNKFS